MEEKLIDIVNGLIAELRKYGLKEPTIQLYKASIHSLIDYCNLDPNVIFSHLILEKFSLKSNEHFKNGKHCYEYHRFQKRIIRLLDSFVSNGEPDFSNAKNSRKYVPSNKHQKYIEKIIEENNLKNEAILEMDRVLRHFFCFIEIKEIKVMDLTDDILLEFMQVASKSKSGSMYRVTRALRLISVFFKKRQMGELKIDFSMFKTKSSPIRLIEPYSKSEIKKILKSVNTDTTLGLRDRAVILLAFETGLRGCDIVNLKFEDVNWNLCTIHIIQKKTQEALLLPLNGEVMNAIADYILKARPNSDVAEIFIRSRAPYRKINTTCALDSLIEKYQLLANVEKKPYRSFHSLRRAFATELSISGVPLPTISQMLGHKSIAKDRPYLSYDKSQIMFCAMGFDEIPITDGIYASLHEESLNRLVWRDNQ